MLKQASTEQAGYKSGQGQTIVYTPIARTDFMGESHIEDYLDHAIAPLVGKVSYVQRQAERARLRTQIEASVRAYEELGYERSEAIALTLTRQNVPFAVSNPGHTQITEQTEDVRLRHIRTTYGVYFGILMVATLIEFASAGWNWKNIPDPSTNALLWDTFLGLGLLPALMGLRIGCKAPHRPYQAVVMGSAHLLLPMFLFVLFLLAFFGSSLFDEGESRAVIAVVSFITALITTVLHSLALLLAGWVGVAVAQKQRKRHGE